MQRSIRLSMKFSTVKKTSKIQAVLDRYRSCVNKYIQSIWINGGSLDKKTADLVPLGHLLFNQRGCALKQALSIVSSTKKSQKSKGCDSVMPVFSGGMVLSDRLAELEPSKNRGKFDYYLRVTTLNPRKRISIPVKGTRVLDKWLNKRLAKLKPGCIISERNGKLYAIVWVVVPDPPPKIQGIDLGLDIGMNKLIATSDGSFEGEKTKEILSKIRRCKPGSRGRQKAHEHRRHYFGEVLNKLNWKKLRLIAIENLKNIKKGKKPKRGKEFRKIVAPWTAASVLLRIKLKAQEYRVSCVEVDPKYTSQTCPICTHRATSNRSNEKFKCVSCGYANDADTVGSLNILNRALGSISSPNFATSKDAKI